MHQPSTERIRARLYWLVLTASITFVALLPWLRNRAYVRSFFDYGVVMGGIGRIEGGQRPYVDFITPIQTGWYYLNWMAEKAAGGTFQAMTWSGAASIVISTLLLMGLLSRKWPLVPSALVAGSMVCATVAQHTIFWYNPWGVVMLAAVAWAGALAPVFARANLGLSLIVCAALFFGGINKINMQLLALAVAWGWGLRAGLTGRSGWGRVSGTLAGYLVCGVVLPVAAEMAWTGASLATWWHNVVALPAAARSSTVFSALSWDFFFKPLHDYYGQLLLPQIGLIGMVLSVVIIAAILRKTWREKPVIERFLPLLCGALAVVAGAVLLTTNMDIAYIGLAGWLALLIGLWLGYGLPGRGRAFQGMIVVPAVIIGIASWYSAWLGQRSQFGHSKAPRADYLDGGKVDRDYAYFAGTMLPPEFCGSLESLAVWRRGLAEQDRGAILYGPGSEWCAHIWPALRTPNLPIYIQMGHSFGARENMALASALRNGDFRQILVSHVLDRWSPQFSELLDEKYERYGFRSDIFLRYTRGPVLGVSAHPVDFPQRFGGSVDSRYLVTGAEPFQAENKLFYLGASEGGAEMRLILPVNRVQGEVIVQRVGSDLSEPVSAHFVIYAQQNEETRYERWSQSVEVPAGQTEAVASYAIDASHLPTTYVLEIPAKYAGKLRAGWRNPTITDVGSDSTRPDWFTRRNSPIEVFDEPAMAKLFSGDWRPSQVQMRNGRVTDEGIELSAGGEIWIQVQGIVTKLSGTATIAPGVTPVRLPVVRGLWYKAGRLQSYASPSPEKRTDRFSTFQAWCAEPDGWLVIAVDRTLYMSPVIVRVTEIEQHQ